MSDSRHPSGSRPAPAAGGRRVTRARPIGDLIGRTLDKACRRRGFATSDLLADWPDIIGARYAGRVQPVRLDWPRPPRGVEEPEPQPATLVVQCDGATALLLTHDMPQVVERINGFFGWAAVSRLRILQRPLTPRRVTAPPPLRPLTESEEADLAARIAGVSDTRLAAALDKLGRAVVARRR